MRRHKTKIVVMETQNARMYFHLFWSYSNMEYHHLYPCRLSNHLEAHQNELWRKREQRGGEEKRRGEEKREKER